MSNLNISNCGQLIKEVEKKYNSHCDSLGIKNPHVIVNNSGGKDSGATDLLAMAILGDDGYRSVACDTGNENNLTIEHLGGWHNQRGGKPVEIISANYSQELFDKRKTKVEKQWQSKMKVMAGSYRGVIMPSLSDPSTKFSELWRKNANRVGWGDSYQSPIDAFREAFVRSGNPFLDMCMLHGGIPLGRQRYCTDELKIDVAFNQVVEPLLDIGDEVIQWSGVRGQESEKRASYKEFDVDERGDGYLWNFLPIHKWSHQDVFALHKYFGVETNPLYKMGMGRVGCMPCILVNKEELHEISLRFPEEIERIKEWELRVGKISRWIHWMIVGHVNRRPIKKIKATFGNKIILPRGFKMLTESYDGTCFLGPKGGKIGGNMGDAVEWSKTTRGGKSYDVVTAMANKDLCSSKYGLCG